MTTETTDPRILALAKHLDCDPDEITEGYGDNRFEHGRAEYLVLTDDEADEAARERIEESLWAFNTSFLRAHAPSLSSASAEKAIAKVQEELCEGANELIAALIPNMAAFVRDAIAADGRGHFLAGYDGEENEEGSFYIYREG